MLSGLHLNTQMYQTLDQPFKIPFKNFWLCNRTLESDVTPDLTYFKCCHLSDGDLTGLAQKDEDKTTSLEIFFTTVNIIRMLIGKKSRNGRDVDNLGQISLYSLHLLLPDGHNSKTLSLNADWLSFTSFRMCRLFLACPNLTLYLQGLAT